MFKLVFQAFMLLGISSVYIIIRLGEKGTVRGLFRFPFLLMSILLLTAILQYPKIAVKSYYSELKTYKYLDGTKRVNFGIFS